MSATGSLRRSVARRARRFVDVGRESDFFKSKTVNDVRAFYAADTLNRRVADIRQSIYYIRHNWDKFDGFLASLRQLMSKKGCLDLEDPEVKSEAETLLTKKRDWLASEDVRTTNPTYEAIKLYTSDEGYERIFSLINHFFRQEGSVADTDTIRPLVFMVELINIDLYNYCLKHPERANFEGTVYRGMWLENADIETFKTLRRAPISSRNISVPLGLISTSLNREVAVNFLKIRQESSKSMKPVIFKISVIGLKEEYVKQYTERFPSTVLSTIGAVKIHDLSHFQDEEEVLLRGPFLQILDISEDTIPGIRERCVVVEAVMLNSNRDHISTAFLAGQDSLARDLFRAMVTVTRSEFALKYYERKHLREDAQAYQKVRDENIAYLKAHRATL